MTRRTISLETAARLLPCYAANTQMFERQT